MTSSDHRLEDFEERRLTALKEVVAARARALPARETRTRRPARRTIALAATAVGVSAVAATAVTVTSLRSAPAYAVARDANGVVDVRITRYRDAEGLSRQLRRLGVPAAVYYVPAGKVCHQPFATLVRDVPPGLYSAPTNIPGQENGTGMRLRIDTRLFEPGQFFLFGLKIFHNADGGVNTSVTQYLVTGRVIPCHLAPVTPPNPVISPLVGPGERAPHKIVYDEPSIIVP
ncbi:hypothetical protein [Actinoallomurus soli]|uniref:hypothetical protein n=1 Tax=Actinoallomurus soli TaxID=2952535 RepID=UPI0020927947|nr:hypothetical protein [Actinoallomurus soli]MCO5967825.1 hypothetical protein [Actinoallomurus soli]